ncbi:aminoglycoside phosphotransferase family protein [Aliamphritea hakodatensis]|uniref:aminoglycoside phosphotransferase family protein n=1 Tax=Aliamphritea hakodatensis TaxID=2895352 RepID=UPI0022FD4175|nr:phosphotransferase [Aliamphritea hakodatensis]
MGQRLAGLRAWVVDICAASGIDLASDWQCQPVSGDASFRRYFRLISGQQSWILMDAPPEKEASLPFVKIADSWYSQGIKVPQVIAADLSLGYMLLSDLGDEQYLPHLNDSSADDLYTRALDELLLIQKATDVAGFPLPEYDEALLQREMALFHDWFLQDLLGLTIKPGVEHLWQEVCAQLVNSARAQPQVAVHRDYHSRNLMVCGDSLGVIDFQDAVIGPVTYDLVSLLRDCYIAWPDIKVYGWVDQYGAQLEAEGVLESFDRTEFYYWFDLMGVQRHLKASGIFARLKLRDGKDGYLADIPRTLHYIIRVCSRYQDLLTFAAWLNEVVVPAMYASEHFDTALLDKWFK